MKIHPELSIEELVNEFSNHYPGLKLELYNQEHGEGENSSKNTIIDHNMKLKNINSSISELDINLDAQMTVAELESTFRKAFSLNVQVFRRSNKIWLQTSATDNWTLEVQNRKGLHSVQE